MLLRYTQCVYFLYPNPTRVSPALSPPPPLYQCLCVVGVCVEWSLVSVYSGESLASWHVTCDVLRCGLPLWDPRGRVVEAQHPPSPGRPQRPLRALGRWSLQRFSSLPQAKKRWSERWRWDWPRPPSQMPGEGWDSGGALLWGCWAGTGAISAPRSPLSAPQCTLFLSSLLLIHTLKRCCGTISSPYLCPATNPSTHHFFPPDSTNHDQTQCSCCLLSSLLNNKKV